MTDVRPGMITSRADFARELSSLRDAAGLTVRQLAARVAVVGGHSTIGDWFAGRAMPSTSSRLMFVDVLRACGVTDDEEIERWMAAWRSVRRPSGRRAAGPEPYRGLSSFQPSDAEWFFGRDEQVAALVESMAALDRAGGGLQLVVGASGSGKSSLLRAGLIPALGGRPVALTVPGEAPVAGLRSQVGPDAKVIIVDQMEQVFAAVPDEQRTFVDELCARATGGALVVLGVRADFYPQLLAHPQLLAATGDRQLTVGPMTEAQLREVITAPARRAGVELDDGLVELLMRDIAPGQAEAAGPSGGNVLPLLSHALYQTWENSPNGRMTIEAYRNAGGVGGGVAASADRAYGGLTGHRREVARRLFLRLVHVGTDAADTRRRIGGEELLASFPARDRADLQQVLDAFVDQRLITVDLVAVEITHDALLYAWPMLRSWIDEDRAGLVVGQQLAVAAGQWRDDDRDRAALYQGGRLATAQEWHRAHAAEASPLVTEFLTASTGHAHRRTRRLYGVGAALVALLVTAVAAAGYGFSQRQSAIAERDRAISRLVAGQAQRLRDSDPALAKQLSLAAYRISPTVEARSSLLDAPVEPTVTRLLGSLRALQAAQYSPDRTLLAATGLDGVIRLWNAADPSRAPVARATVPASAQPLFALAFSPDGRILAAAGADATITLWDLLDPHRPVRIGAPLTGPASTVYALAFDPAGEHLVAGSHDTRIWRWEIKDPHRPRPLPPLTPSVGEVHALAYDSGGSVLAAGGNAGGVMLYRADAQTPAGPAVHAADGTVFALAFAADGATLASGGSDARVRLWDVRDPALPSPQGNPLTGPNSWINSVAFSPDGTSVAAGSSDKTVTVWDTATAATALTLPHPTPVTAVSYRDQDTLLTAGTDGILRLWAVPGPVASGTDPIFNTGFSDDGRTLVTAGRGGTLQLWNLTAPRGPRRAGSPIRAPAGTPAYSAVVAIDRLGSTLAVGTRSGSVHLWNVAEPARPVAGRLLRGPTALVESVAFSPDGQLLAAGGDDGKVYLWDRAASTDAPIAVLNASGQVMAIAFSRAGHLLASADTDGNARVWNLTDARHPIEFGPALGGFDGYVYSVAFTPDGRTLAVGSADTTIRFWDLSVDGHPRPVGGVLRGPTSYVYWLTYSPDGRHLAAAVGDGTLWLWQTGPHGDPTPYAALTRPRAGLYTVAYAPDGRVLAAAGADGVVRLWDPDPDRVASWICATAGTPITPVEWARYIPGAAYRSLCP
ncbi:helix-turn-helix domain-containing protein [Dactylosporangium sp. NBC_01737]|uniref:nSTAND1 domain-containing NTPase n=1 Tax=Dactylosporangium sp. NBC_01737 TaxID=2975959 RepID=UPI002E10B4EE|nr:helix-turn-helix domain-containing protein [Dactylosporangium sp. NBC_01737]